MTHGSGRRAKNLCHLLAILHVVLPVEGHRLQHRQLDREGTRPGWTPEADNRHTRALLMATSARFRWPSPRSFVSAYAQNLMAADNQRSDHAHGDLPRPAH